MTSEVTIEREGAISILSINRPEARNALTLPVLSGLTNALESTEKDGVRCIVITGVGGHFCAGADLRKNLEDPGVMDRLDEYMDAFHGLIKAIVRCPVPTIAMMDGAAVGFGADMGFACDLRVMSDEAYIQEKFVSLGLMPDGGGTFFLPRLVGSARAMRMFLLAEKVSSKELNDLGVVAELAPVAALRQTTLALAQKIAKGPPLAYAAIKKAVWASWGDIEMALRRERDAQLRLLKTADLMEGVAAWMQKREPVFQGK